MSILPLNQIDKDIGWASPLCAEAANGVPIRKARDDPFQPLPKLGPLRNNCDPDIENDSRIAAARRTQPEVLMQHDVIFSVAFLNQLTAQHVVAANAAVAHEAIRLAYSASGCTFLHCESVGFLVDEASAGKHQDAQSRLRERRYDAARSRRNEIELRRSEAIDWPQKCNVGLLSIVALDRSVRVQGSDGRFIQAFCGSFVAAP